jgi:alanine racemase
MLIRRDTIMTMSSINLIHNIKIIKQKAKSAKIIAAVKANAYGHGLKDAAFRLEKYVDMLGVAFIDEAIFLRKNNIKIPIMLLEGVFKKRDLKIAAKENFHVVFHHQNQIEFLSSLNLKKPINAWLKIDTGMNRLGFDIKEAKYFYQKLLDNPNIKKPVRMMSHFACADIASHPLNQTQITRFKSLTNDINTEYSLCNSAGIFNFPDNNYHFVRPGLAIYGASPLSGKTASDLDLKPVMTLKTSLISIKLVTKGSSIGYCGRYICPKDMLIGVGAIGYGDGYPRSAKDGTPILVNNIKCQLVGSVSMDMITIDLTNCQSAKIGDKITLWGDNLAVEEVAKYTNNVAYDLLTVVRERIKFSWD